jgi:hypothetical protein
MYLRQKAKANSANGSTIITIPSVHELLLLVGLPYHVNNQRRVSKPTPKPNIQWQENSVFFLFC